MNTVHDKSNKDSNFNSLLFEKYHDLADATINSKKKICNCIQKDGARKSINEN